MKKVLIAGASGLVGQALLLMLKKEGFEVCTLSTKQLIEPLADQFVWNPSAGTMDIASLEGVDHVINLSGAGIFDQSWSVHYKQELYDSRVKSTALLARHILKSAYPVKTFINASGTGIYGPDTGAHWLDENSPVGDGFLAALVVDWEKALLDLPLPGLRKVCLRFGIVLSDKGGFLAKMITPANYYLASPLGSGQQYISWIHIQDLCRMILFVLRNSQSQGVYNAVAPHPVTNQEMTRAIVRRMKKRIIAPRVPSFMLKILFGQERAALLLGGNRVKNDKIVREGFYFDYKTLDHALDSFFPSGNNA